MRITFLPVLNACLNGLAALSLICGWLAIKKGRRDIHPRWMVSALLFSTLFLCSYLTYHFLAPGITKYQGQGPWKIIYYFILLTHTPLAVIVVPLSLVAVGHALRKRYHKHKQVTRWLFPIWLYVSLTGVLIYLLLYVFKF